MPPKRTTRAKKTTAAAASSRSPSSSDSRGASPTPSTQSEVSIPADHSDHDTEQDTQTQTQTQSQSHTISRNRKSKKDIPPYEWTDDRSKALAECVEMQPCLYDKKHKDWVNVPGKLMVWNQIGEKMEPPATGEQCKKWYDNQRTRMGKIMRKKSGQGRQVMSAREEEIVATWQFLRQHIQRLASTSSDRFSPEETEVPPLPTLNIDVPVAEDSISSAGEDLTPTPGPSSATGRPSKRLRCSPTPVATPTSSVSKADEFREAFLSVRQELCFTKGDIITVTQALDEGWWEGTLSGKTGWFPSNYVKEVKADLALKTNKSDVPPYKRESMQLYHNVVLKNIIETEKTHVSGMTQILQTYILPLKNAGILTVVEYNQLVGNLEQLIAFQRNLFCALEECEKLAPMQRRIGGAFMKHAEQLKQLYMDYCGNHPKAVSVLQRHRENLSRYMESNGAPSPGSMTLTTNLSKPFTRLDRYPSLLKELERHIEESHPDRGDTQRAIVVYREIANSCLEIRKLKEMELEIITSTITGWEGEPIASLGEVVHLSQVKVHKQTGEKYDRIFVLFPNVLVMLSMSPRLSGYQYEGKLPLSGMNVTRCDDPENYPNGFEISGNMIEKIVVTCGTRVEVGPWVDILRQQIQQSYHSSTTKPQSLQISISTSQPSISTVKSQAKTAQVTHSTVPPSVHPHPHSPPHHKQIYKTWSMSCLRPSPPLRPALMCRDEALKSPKANRKSTAKRKPDDQTVYNEDAFILQVIEAYCNSAKTRHTVNSSVLSSPHVLIPDNEKLFVENDVQEKTLVDTVYSLGDKVRLLEQEQKRLKKDLDDERKARQRLENVVHKSLGRQFLDSASMDSISTGAADTSMSSDSIMSHIICK